MDKQLRRILDLIRRTGDRMVVTDTNGEDVYVVMGLEQYESLVDVLPSDDDGGWDDNWLDDHTGLDNPPDPSGPPLSGGPVGDGPADIWEAMQPAGEKGETWDIQKMSDGEKSELERQFEEYQREKRGEAGKEEKEKEKEIESAKKDEDFGEEQFYLEPIE